MQIPKGRGEEDSSNMQMWEYGGCLSTVSGRVAAMDVSGLRARMARGAAYQFAVGAEKGRAGLREFADRDSVGAGKGERNGGSSAAQDGAYDFAGADQALGILARESAVFSVRDS